ncbi:hypothetical protein OROHE_025009 [Orobanche hederae]
MIRMFQSPIRTSIGAIGTSIWIDCIMELDHVSDGDWYENVPRLGSQRPGRGSWPPKPICGVLVFLAAKSGFIKDNKEAADFQNFIICVEMLVAAIGHLYAFPFKVYAGANIGANHGFTASLAHALKLNDFYHDTVHQFAPTYHDYVLYNPSDSSDDGSRKYRARTFVPTGSEMGAVRKNKNMFGNKLEDIQLASLSGSSSSSPENSGSINDTVKSDVVDALSLIHVSDNTDVSGPYDHSLLIDIDMSSYPDKVPAASEAGTR